MIDPRYGKVVAGASHVREINDIQLEELRSLPHTRRSQLALEILRLHAQQGPAVVDDAVIDAANAVLLIALGGEQEIVDGDAGEDPATCAGD